MTQTTLTVIARIKAKQGLAQQVRNELESLIEPTRAEPGCIDYVPHQAKDDEHLFLFFENWASRKALDEHLQKPHIQAFIAKANDILSEPLDVSLWEQVGN